MNKICVLFAFFLFKQNKKNIGDVKVQNTVAAEVAVPLDLMLFVTYLCLTDVPAVLVLCWMELIFFTVASMGYGLDLCWKQH